MIEVYQFKITLDGVSPPIWRRVKVRSDITFTKFHNIIQVAMGWENYHMYSFEFKYDTIGIADELLEDMGFTGDLNAAKIKLNEMFSAEKKCKYHYDFGDDWMHTVALEKVLEASEEDFVPVCTGGRRRCPPEDCGGPYGYQELLETINNPDNPEYKTMREWLMGERNKGKTYDDAYFNLDEVNEELPHAQELPEDIGDEESPFDDVDMDDEPDEPEELPPPSIEQWRELYDLAKKVQAAKPWELLNDSDYIAIQPGDYSEPIFFAPIGNLGQAFGLIAYPGRLALGTAESLRMRAMILKTPFTSIGRHRCISLHFGDRDDVSKEDRAIIKELGLKFRGHNQWIYFQSLIPGYEPCQIDSVEAQMFIDCLHQYVAVFESLRRGELVNEDWARNYVELCEGCDGSGWETLVLPRESLKPGFRTMFFSDNVLEARLKKAKRCKASWEADAFYLPVPFGNSGRSAYFASTALVADRDTGEILKISVSQEEDDSIEALLMNVVVECITEKGRPLNLYTCAPDTGIVLSDLYEKLNITPHICEPMLVISEAVGQLFEQLGMGMGMGQDSDD